MKKIQVLTFGIPMNWLAIAALLVCVPLGSWAISAGKIKTVAILLLPVLIFAVRACSERTKFWLLAFSIPLSLMQMPSLPAPYGTSVSEAILMLLALDEMLFPRDDHTRNIKPGKPETVILLALFALAGLVTNLRQGDIYTWNVYCLTPLIAFFVISRKLHDSADAWLLVKLSLLTLVGFIAIVQWAIATGHFEVYDPLGTEAMASAYRLADGMIIGVGPIQITAFATRMGGIAVLGLPTCLLLWLDEKRKLWWKVVLLFVMVGLGYVLILSATRGSLVAAIVGSLLVILLSGRFRSPVFLGSAALLIALTPVAGSLLALLPGRNIWRLQTLFQGVQAIANYQQRLDVLAFAWKLTLQNPLGVGFGYLYHTYRIDDAIIYAVILQGTGILGAVAFILIMVYLAFQFGLGVLNSQQRSIRDLAAIGLSTLAAGLLAGVSTQSILFEPVHAFVFWALLGTCYWAVVYFASRFAL